MANSITGINDDIISRSVLEGYTTAIAPLSALTADFSSDAVRRGEKVSIMRDNSAIDAALDKTSHGAYAVQDADSDAVEVTMGQPKYVSWGLDDSEIANSSVLSMEKFGRRKGNLLAKTVMQDILSEVTNANFGAASFTGAAGTFDEDDVADVAEDCDSADWAQDDRYLVLSPSYIAALRKSGAIKDTSGYGYNAIQNGDIPMLHGFKVIMSNAIPANGENLVGFATDGNGIASAFRYLAPQEGHKYNRAEALVGEGGITLGFRDWYSEDSGVRKSLIESVYGYETGISTGIKRLVSA
jgi:hypothetical protein